MRWLSNGLNGLDDLDVCPPGFPGDTEMDENWLDVSRWQTSLNEHKLPLLYHAQTCCRSSRSLLLSQGFRFQSRPMWYARCIPVQPMLVRRYW